MTLIVLVRREQAEQQVAGGRVVVVARAARRRWRDRTTPSSGPAPDELPAGGRVEPAQALRAASAAAGPALAGAPGAGRSSSARATGPGGRWPRRPPPAARGRPRRRASAAVQRPCVAQLAEGEHGAAAEIQVVSEVDARQQDVQSRRRGRPGPAPRRRGTGSSGRGARGPSAAARPSPSRFRSRQPRASTAARRTASSGWLARPARTGSTSLPRDQRAPGAGVRSRSADSPRGERSMSRASTASCRGNCFFSQLRSRPLVLGVRDRLVVAADRQQRVDGRRRGRLRSTSP